MATDSQSIHMPPLSSFLSSLRAFATSSSSFRILHSLPVTKSYPSSAPQILYILDSSFNPPTLAHLRICLSALRSDDRRRPGPRRLLLLLATQNADKPPKPAGFEQRLGMMGLLAQDIQSNITKATGNEQGRANKVDGYGQGSRTEEDVTIDIGVCKLPLFVDKVKAIEESHAYGNAGGTAEQVHLIGYDTVVRLLDAKYYPPEHNLKPLESMFEKHRVRVTMRTDGNVGQEEQVKYLRRLGEGEREHEGGRRAWAHRIELVEGRKEGEEVVSSTRVRESVKKGNDALLDKLVTYQLVRWIKAEQLYKDND